MTINNLLESVSKTLWGPATILLLFACGVYFTVRSGFFQIRFFPLILRNTLGQLFAYRKQKAGISPFSALATALSGAIGVGNIVGVALAITAGGPGACFWMWVSALFGMMTKFAEIFLAMRYRDMGPDGSSGSAVSFLQKGVGSPALAHAYAFFALLTAFGLGCAVQTNALTETISTVFSVPKIVPAALAALLTALLLWKGIRAIAGFSTILMPLMSLIYIGCSLAIIAANLSALPGVLSRIFFEAFSLRAAAGGGIFAAVRYGFARGVFSNEAGLGTSAAAHCASAEKDPAAQGLWGILEVFIDTIVMCTLTAFAILVTGKTTMDEAARSVLGSAGPALVAVSLTCFALSTIIAWSYYGSVYFSYLFRGRGAVLYRFLFCGAVVAGGLFSSELVWCAADISNGLILFPNIVGLILLSPQVAEGIRRYKKKAGFPNVI